MNLLDLARAELAANPFVIPIWHIGDQVRVLRREGVLHQAHIGDVGAVVAVLALHPTPGGCMIYHAHAVRTVALVDFGPDDDRHGGRDAWSYADADLVDADAPMPKRKRARHAR